MKQLMETLKKIQENQEKLATTCSNILKIVKIIAEKKSTNIEQYKVYITFYYVTNTMSKCFTGRNSHLHCQTLLSITLQGNK